MARHRALTIILIMLIAPLVTAPVSAAGNGQYVSRALGFSLDWDDSWAVVDESADLLSESITLSNETSMVTFRALLGFGGDSQLCLDYVEDEFTLAPEFGIAGLRAK
ncbi:MAG TPA: hypothetical protein VGR16_09580 [Thermomicrobiales bacterium]|nr:hypothetical protein [Thermomicrobiales bacterium]